ncbi:MAG: hypothetical protein ACRD0P_33445, partial [Stackebrandtia sp.]
MTSRTQAPSRHVSGWTALGVVAAIVLALMLIAYGAWWLAAQITGDTIPGNPFVAFGFRQYRELWTPLATVFTIIAEAVVIGVAVWGLVRWSQRSKIDRRAKAMASPRDLSEVTGRSAV